MENDRPVTARVRHMGQNVPRGASTFRAAQIKMEVYCKV